MSCFFRKLKWFWGRRAKEEELHDEIQFHLEEEAEQRQAEGLTAEEAKWAARREFGSPLLFEESTRATWSILGDGEMSDVLADIKHALRMFRRSPGFTVTAVAALGLGIGATTAVFSIVNAAVLRPLPVRDPDRFVLLMTRSVNQKGESTTTSAASPVKYAYWKTLSNVLEDVSAFGGMLANYTGGDRIEQLAGVRASADAFRAFGIPILRGRTFTPAEDSPHGPHVALISQEMWRNRFSSDPQILGKSIALNGDAYTIVGVVAYDRAWRSGAPPRQCLYLFSLIRIAATQATIFRCRPG